MQMPDSQSRTASTRPVTSAVGYCQNKNLLGIVVCRECNHGPSPGRDCPKARCDFVANRSLVRNVPQARDCLLNLHQLSACGRTSRILDDPLGDCLQVPRHKRMEANSIHYFLRAATTAARAAAKAVSRSTYSERSVCIRVRTSSARTESATSRSSSSCIMCSTALATAALRVAKETLTHLFREETVVAIGETECRLDGHSRISFV